MKQFLFLLFISSTCFGANTMFSASHRFVVQGFAPTEAPQITSWADDVASKVEAIIKKEIVVRDGQQIKIIARHDDANRGRVDKAQTYVDDLLQQQIDVINPEKIDQEDILEALVELLMNRYVIEGQTTSQRKAHLGSVPEWLSVGLAQNLFPQLRSRNRQGGLARWNHQEKLMWEDLMKLDSMPAGRWGQKMDAALGIQWLLTLHNADAVLRSYIGRLCSGGNVTPEQFATELLKFPTIVDLEKNWDLWIAQQQDVHDELGEIDQGGIDQLKRLLLINPADYGVVSSKVPSSLTFAQLVEWRDESWLPRLAERISIKIKFLSIGRPPEYQDVVNRYAVFLDALRGVAPGYSGGLFGHKPSDDQLTELLRQANQAVDDLEKRWAKQREYLDQFDAGQSYFRIMP